MARSQIIRLTWLLRLVVAGEFFGHGYFAIQRKPEWVPFITQFGFSQSTALQLMPIIGYVDWTLALIVLVRPSRAALIWMSCWGLFTALLRPMVGLSMFEFIERAPNWGAPLALLLMLHALVRQRAVFA